MDGLQTWLWLLPLRAEWQRLLTPSHDETGASIRPEHGSSCELRAAVRAFRSALVGMESPAA